MLAWLRGDQQPEDDDVDQDLIISDQIEADEPETPGAAAFAFNAFRNGLFGTPKPDIEIHEREREPRPRLGRNVLSDDDVFTSRSRSNSKKRSDRFLTFEDVTPTKKNPQSILVTPGNTISKKKSVTFGPDQYHEDTISYESRTGRVRSGLPPSYPGKFPSPWTPKVTHDLPKRRLRDTSRKEEIEIFEDESPKLTETGPKTEPSRDLKDGARSLVDDQIQALRENTARINDLMEESAQQEHEPDVTVNLDEPRSRSGVYWKERYSTDLNQAERKVEFYKARKDTSVEFASRKDEQCANLATRLKEEMELRRKMQAEIDKWQKLAMEAKPEPPSPTINAPLTETYQQKTIERLRRENSEYRETIRQKEAEMNDHEYQLDRQRSEIERQVRRIKDLEAALKQKKEAADEISIYNTNAEAEIRSLKRELRKAENAASGKDLLLSKFESSQREVERLKQQVSLVKDENQRLKAQQRSAASLLDLDDVPIVPTAKEYRPPTKLVPETEPEDIWQSLSGLNAPKDKPARPSNARITEQSVFPNIRLVDSKPELTGIFSKSTQPSKPPKGSAPNQDDYLKTRSPLATKPTTSSVKSTPNTRKPTLSGTPIMSEREIMQQLDHSDLSLPPLSPSVTSGSEDELERYKPALRPVSRHLKDDLTTNYDFPATKPSKPLDDLDDNKLNTVSSPTYNPQPSKPTELDEEKLALFAERLNIADRKPSSPIPKMLNFEKTPAAKRPPSLSPKRPKRSSLDLCDATAVKTSAALATTVECMGVGITSRASPGSDTDAKRKLAAAKMAEMKARMKAANKENRA
ncbi:hypothetical protein ABW19_dt0200079 [Dactylella cylindrospora]|nr:hypothetical protein ABW19_dt0200079 [Dactylella cylindrospora]